MHAIPARVTGGRVEGGSDTQDYLPVFTSSAVPPPPDECALEEI